MEHKLPILNYGSGALASKVSAETIEYHRGKHNKGYADHLNRHIVGTQFEGCSLKDIVKKRPNVRSLAQHKHGITHSISTTLHQKVAVLLQERLAKLSLTLSAHSSSLRLNTLMLP